MHPCRGGDKFKTTIMKKENKIKDTNVQILEKRIAELVNTIDKVEDEKLVLENQFKKALADYHNLSSSMAKRQSLSFFNMKKRLSEEFMPALDSMTLSIESEKTLELDEKEKAWFEGVLAIFESMKKSLESIGLKTYLPKVGDMFDTAIHEAIATSQGGEHGRITSVIQPGYTLDDLVIRTSKVIVSK